MSASGPSGPLVLIYDEEVTIRKRKSVLGHFAATGACIQPRVHFLS